MGERRGRDRREVFTWEKPTGNNEEEYSELELSELCRWQAWLEAGSMGRSFLKSGGRTGEGKGNVLPTKIKLTGEKVKLMTEGRAVQTNRLQNRGRS